MWLLDGNSGVVGRLLRALGAPASSLLGDPALGAAHARRRRRVEAHRVRDDRLPRGAAGRAARRCSRRPRSTAPARGRASATSRCRCSRPTAAFVATTSLVTSFQAFDVVRIMTQGGPARATELFVYAIYEQIFLDLSVGRASALTVVFFVAAARASPALQLARVAGARGPRDEGAPRSARCARPRARVRRRRRVARARTRGWSSRRSRRCPRSSRTRRRRCPSTSTLGAYREVFATLPGRPLHGRHRLHGGDHRGCCRSRSRCRPATRSPSCASSGKRFAFGIVLACLLVPAQATFVPVFLHVRARRTSSTR